VSLWWKWVVPKGFPLLITETAFQGHRVLVADPAIAQSGAPVILILHGLGANAEDLAPLVNELDLPHCRFVLPDAPLHLTGYPAGAYAWYDFESHDPVGFQASREYLWDLMDRYASDPNIRPAPGTDKKPSPVVMTGFSQGGVMSLETGLLWKGGVKAIVAMSGYMPNGPEVIQRAVAPKQTPILLVHGQFDPVVPIEGSYRAAEDLMRAGYAPILKMFPMEHTITEASLNEVRHFLQAALSA